MVEKGKKKLRRGDWLIGQRQHSYRARPIRQSLRGVAPVVVGQQFRKGRPTVFKRGPGRTKDSADCMPRPSNHAL